MLKKLVNLTLIVATAAAGLLFAGCPQQPASPPTTVAPALPAAAGPSPAPTSPPASDLTRALPPASSPAPAPLPDATSATLPAVPTVPTPPDLPTPIDTPPPDSLPGPTPTAAPSPVTLPQSVAETIDGWVFQRIDLPQASLHFQSDTATEALERGLRAIPLAASRVPQLLGAPPLPKVDVYFFRSRDEFRRGITELAKASSANLSATFRGYSIASGPHPGTYHDASNFTDAAETIRTIAHEFTHQVERRMAAGRSMPQWFNEGVAEAIAVKVAGEAEPDYEARLRFTRSARSVNAARANALPALLPLQTGSQWATAMGPAGFVQQVAFLAVERRANSVGAGLASLGQVLSRIGLGETFDQAFSGAYGQTPAVFEQGFRAYVSGPLAQEFPPGLKAQRNTVKAGERLQFVWLGLQPGEVISREHRGPGTCRNTGSGAADANGFMSFNFTRSLGSPCPGEWTFTGTGNKGSSGTFTFQVTNP